MSLLGWFRSKRPALPPAPPAEPCPLCGGVIAEVRLALHALHIDGLSSRVESGRCSSCDTRLSRVFAGDGSPVWGAVVPAPEQLLAPVSPEELEALSTRFASLYTFERAWAEFLAARRPGDEVWRFAGSGGGEGFAVVRQGRPLAQFLAPDAEFERQLREYAARQAEP